MKTLLTLAFILVVQNSWALTLKLETFDQLKLDELLRRMPEGPRQVEKKRLVEPREGLRVTSTFPATDAPFKMVCSGDYFNGSPYPSSSSCKVTIDEDHPDVDKKYDELRTSLKDKELVRALYQAISLGRPKKEFRSFGKDKGTIFEGKFTFVFHYYFTCTEERCLMRFSDKITAREN